MQCSEANFCAGGIRVVFDHLLSLFLSIELHGKSIKTNVEKVKLNNDTIKSVRPNSISFGGRLKVSFFGEKTLNFVFSKRFVKGQ